MPITRAEKARRTRQRMLDAAARLFTERGWTRTTVEDVARAAEVGVQTVYFTFGNKRALLKEVLAEPDPAAQLARQAAGARRVLERAAPVLEVVRTAAAAEPELAGLWRLNREQRHTVQLRFAEALVAKTALRDGHDASSAADIALTILGPEAYDLLVTGRGWTADRWERWAADALVRQLLP